MSKPVYRLSYDPSIVASEDLAAHAGTLTMREPKSLIFIAATFKKAWRDSSVSLLVLRALQPNHHCRCTVEISLLATQQHRLPIIRREDHLCAAKSSFIGYFE